MKLSLKHLAAMAISVAITLPVLASADEDYTTVNKSVRVDSGTSAGKVGSVNGSIRVGSDSVVRSVESVNGAIDISEGVKVEKNVKAVNGSIGLGSGSEVGGGVETVNGGIKLEDTTVAGDIETVNGSIRLLDGTVVEGNVAVRKPWGWSSGRNKPVKVEIGENVRVYGDLIFEHPVELRIHDSASVGEVIGDEVTVIEG